MAELATDLAHLYPTRIPAAGAHAYVHLRQRLWQGGDVYPHLLKSPTSSTPRELKKSLRQIGQRSVDETAPTAFAKLSSFTGNIFCGQVSEEPDKNPAAF